MKTATLVSQEIDLENPDPTEYTPQKLIRIYLDSYNYLPAQLGTCRDALWNLIQHLGYTDIHVELTYGSISTNVSLSSEDNSQMAKVELAIKLAREEILEILDELFPGKLSGVIPYLTRQYGLAVPTVLVAVQPSSQTNWQSLRRLILGELRKYTKSFMEVEFYGIPMVLPEEIGEEVGEEA